MPKIKIKIEADFQNVNVEVSGEALGRSAEFNARYGKIPMIDNGAPRSKAKRQMGSGPDDVDA